VTVDGPIYAAGSGPRSFGPRDPRERLASDHRLGDSGRHGRDGGSLCVAERRRPVRESAVARLPCLPQAGTLASPAG
jgi:hypothetical protein